MEDQMKFQVLGEPWAVTLVDPVFAEEGGTNTISDFEIKRDDGKFFTIRMVRAAVYGKDGQIIRFNQPMMLENAAGHDRSGDIRVILRPHPITGRYMLQWERDYAQVTPTEIVEVKRVTRSSVDNPEQVNDRRVSPTGEMHLNTRRIGGLPVKTHGDIAPWSPQLEQAGMMMDVYDFVNTPDSPGLAALMKMFQHIPPDTARAIFENVITPPPGR